jgi:putative ATPase
MCATSTRNSSSTQLFDAAENPQGQPLAYRMRPRSIDEYVGQDHIVGPGRLLRRMIQADQLSSIIFYGPPGTGKTTLARVIANTTKSTFITLNAVLSGVKDLRKEIAEARERETLYQTRTILFIDEVHRWNKAQQDALLPWVENGTVILIGATTQNPYFEVIAALVSRSRIFQLKPLLPADLRNVVRAALGDSVRGYGAYRVTIEEDALEHLVLVASGDARSLLNAIELAVETTPESFPPLEGHKIRITLATAEESIQRKAVLYDKEGDYHFDTISAFIKSLRGSDPDAALYWMARMVHAGEDPHYIFRRMLILAGEDVGLADPQALGVVVAAASAFDRVGLPEGQFHLTQAALYLATAPKSNSSLAFFDALQAVKDEAAEEVPGPLRDSNRDKEGFGHGEGYLYPHAYRDHWVAQQYLPGGLQGRIFYEPSKEGYEGGVRHEVMRRREAQLAAWLPGSDTEVLTYSPGDKSRERWLSRVSSRRSEILSDIRDKVFSSIEVQRHDRVLVLNIETGLLLWEGYRRVPEGGVWGIARNPDHRSSIEHFAQDLRESERPVITEAPLAQALTTYREGEVRFESVVGMNVFLREHGRGKILETLLGLMVPGSFISLAETVPRHAQRLSGLLTGTEDNLVDAFRSAEERVYTGGLPGMTDWDEDDILKEMADAGFKDPRLQLEHFTESRVITDKDLTSWFDPSHANGPSYGSIVRECMGEESASEIKALLANLSGRPIDWRRTVAFVTASS